MKQVIVCVLGLLFVLTAEAQINWTSLEEAVEQSKIAPKKIIVKIYSEECVWCKRMDKQTLNDPSISSYVEENFYAVALNASSKEDITFKDETYQFVKKSGRSYHELAAKMTRGNLSFPSIVFFDEDLNIIQSINGFKEKALFMRIITYFGYDYHKSIPWSEYQNQALNASSVKE